MLKGIVLAWMVAVLMTLGLGPAVSEAATPAGAPLDAVVIVDAGADVCMAEVSLPSAEASSSLPDGFPDASDLLPAIIPPAMLPAEPFSAPRFDPAARRLPQVDELLRPPRVAVLTA